MKSSWLSTECLTMGHSVSKVCAYDLRAISPENLAKLTSASYTVIRTNGDEQDGWMISTARYAKKADRSYDGWEDAFCTDQYEDSTGKYGMKFFMTNGWWYMGKKSYSRGDFPDDAEMQEESLLGWRSNYAGRRTFWPTGLEGEEKEAWFLWLDEQAEIAKDCFTAKNEELAKINAEEKRRAAEEEKHIKLNTLIQLRRKQAAADAARDAQLLCMTSAETKAFMFDADSNAIWDAQQGRPYTKHIPSPTLEQGPLYSELGFLTDDQYKIVMGKARE